MEQDANQGRAAAGFGDGIMRGGPDALQRLLGPVGRERFFEHHWERMSLLVRATGRRSFDDVLCRRDFDAAIASGAQAPADDRLQLVRFGESGRQVPVRPDGTVDVAAAYRAYADGYTLMVNRLHTRWRPITDFCRDLQATLGHRVGANLYVTPRDAQGFGAHFDGHDVFVVQLLGSKSWRLYDAPFSLPLEHEGRVVSSEEAGEVTCETTLREGDVLYVPRGHVHEALTGEEASVHLTIGVHVLRWVDALITSLEVAAAQDTALRGAVAGGHLPDVDALGDRLSELLGRVAADPRAQAVGMRLATELLDRFGTVGVGDLASLDRLRSLALDTFVVRRHGARCVVVQDGPKVSIRFPDGMCTASTHHEAALRHIADSERFSASELPGDLNDAERVALVSELVRRGLLSLDSA